MLRIYYSSYLFIGSFEILICRYNLSKNTRHKIQMKLDETLEEILMFYWFSSTWLAFQNNLVVRYLRA
jgi:hypothetical protein